VPISRPNSKGLASKLAVWSSLVVLGLVLVACQSPSHGPSTSDPVPPPADCDNTVPLNHCGSYMPQDNGSLGR
jgi:hypothetical protein